jgi:RimJ/RimL family protein N-acetyltransferase
MIEFISVYNEREATRILYELLKERDPDANISHVKMPTFEEHERFVSSKPYFVWNLIKEEGAYVGSIYLTRNREIGVFIFRQHQGKGYGKSAVIRFMDIVGGSFLANVAPKNERSQKMFESLGGKIVQLTYKLEVK